MRLRPLTEAECYARCYGGRRDDSVTVLPVEQRLARRETDVGLRLHALLAGRLAGARSEQEREAA